MKVLLKRAIIWAMASKGVVLETTGRDVIETVALGSPEVTEIGMKILPSRVVMRAVALKGMVLVMTGRVLIETPALGNSEVALEICMKMLPG
jgi:hypothetical protein